MQRRKPFKYVSNLRDLGGYTTQNGNITKYERVLRSSAIYDLTEAEEKYLLDIGIKSVIDLRMPEEIQRHPSAFRDHDKIKYFNFPLSNAWPSLEDEVPNTYFNMIKDHKTMASIMKTIANTDGGVVFHCTAGKDRTGVVAMLLLLLSEVYEDDIIADYQISYTYIRENIRKMHKDNPDLPAFLGGSKLEYMEETLELFYNKFKTINNYFIYLGFKQNEIEVIKNKLV